MEQWTHKPLVVGSNPTLAIYHLSGGKKYTTFISKSWQNGNLELYSLPRIEQPLQTMTFFAKSVDAD